MAMIQHIWDMFLISDLFSKLVVITIVVLSGYSWGIIIQKNRRFRKIRADGQRIGKFIIGKRGTEITGMTLPQIDHPIIHIIESVKHELGPINSEFMKQYGDSIDRNVLFDSLGESAEAAIEEAMAREERHVDTLSMVANIAPFLGLLGTIWGIIGSFWEIGQQASANISVVAPGLAEALVTTIVGLVAAIPAAIGFGLYTSKLRVLAGELTIFSKKLVAQLKREL
jgi:biopolymer transport protein TolQ